MSSSLFDGGLSDWLRQMVLEFRQSYQLGSLLHTYSGFCHCPSDVIWLGYIAGFDSLGLIIPRSLLIHYIKAAAG